jgi:hypothetical protein
VKFICGELFYKSYSVFSGLLDVFLYGKGLEKKRKRGELKDKDDGSVSFASPRS